MENFIHTTLPVMDIDIIHIITVFSCKLQGKRANKARKLVRELIEECDGNDDKNNKSNAITK